MSIRQYFESYRVKIEIPWEEKMIEIPKSYETVERAERDILKYSNPEFSFHICKVTEELIKTVKNNENKTTL